MPIKRLGRGQSLLNETRETEKMNPNENERSGALSAPAIGTKLIRNDHFD